MIACASQRSTRAGRATLADVDVTPLRLARLQLPDFHPAAPGFDTVYGFLVRDGSSCVLVDTGVGEGSALIERLYQPERVDLRDALAQAGASPGEVTAVVNSHLHFDHCGNNALFPGVPIYVQQAELEAARQPHYTVPAWLDFPGARYVPLQGRHALSERLALHPTPGHTPGHQSLLVDGRALIVAQAAYTAAEFQAFHEAAVDGLAEAGDPRLQAALDANAGASRPDYVASLAALRRLQPERAFFSHDAAVWQRAC